MRVRHQGLRVLARYQYFPGYCFFLGGAVPAGLSMDKPRLRSMYPREATAVPPSRAAWKRHSRIMATTSSFHRGSDDPSTWMFVGTPCASTSKDSRTEASPEKPVGGVYWAWSRTGSLAPGGVTNAIRVRRHSRESNGSRKLTSIVAATATGIPAFVPERNAIG